MEFTKMQALGNDFMIINATNQVLNLSKEMISNLSNRNLGVGFDQLLLIEKSNNNNIDFFCRIFNADGNEVFQCGNGIRCCALFIYYNKLINKKMFSIATNKKRMICKILNNNNVIVDMGEPEFIPSNIPFLCSKINNYYSMYVNNQVIYFGVVSIGNPHCIIIVKDINDPNINVLGPIIEKKSIFPNYINVGFVQILQNNHIKLRVYERGVGETQACGSGACGAVAVGINQQLLCSKVKVDLIGGTLIINWKGMGSSLYMDGPAIRVYDGIIDI
ncbi:Diaminopimelate epimerase [Buchnera aphidicola (Eriosoma lanigerum)]|uniref:diaminopimelate epimerase n=1 Tax=Buchnera aphidicola TaxID=9 RepID=UPI0034647667